MLNTNVEFIFAKIEVTPGTDSVPVAGDAMLVQGIDVKPVQGDRVARELARGFSGSFEGVVTNLSRAISFGVELASSGTAGTAPKYDALLKACGFGTATVTASTKVDYNLVDAAVQPTVTIYRYIKEVSAGGSGATLQRILGARGNVKFTLSPKGVPMMMFDLVGSYTVATSVAVPTGVSFASFTAPLATSRANTTVTIMGASHCVDALDFDLGNAVSWRELYNCNGSFVSDRRAKGSMTVEARSAAVQDWSAAFVAGTTGTASYIHGTTAGNICELAAPRLQISGPPTESRKDGLLMLQIPFDVIPTAANNELVFTAR
jgi:hypothetical protein